MDLIGDTTFLVGLWRRQAWALNFAQENPGKTLGIPWVVRGELWHGAGGRGMPRRRSRFAAQGVHHERPDPGDGERGRRSVGGGASAEGQGIPARNPGSKHGPSARAGPERTPRALIIFFRAAGGGGIEWAGGAGSRQQAGQPTAAASCSSPRTRPAAVPPGCATRRWDAAPVWPTSLRDTRT